MHLSLKRIKSPALRINLNWVYLGFVGVDGGLWGWYGLFGFMGLIWMDEVDRLISNTEFRIPHQTQAQGPLNPKLTKP